MNSPNELQTLADKFDRIIVAFQEMPPVPLGDGTPEGALLAAGDGAIKDRLLRLVDEAAEDKP